MPTVMITGATRGIGYELGRQYLDDGWTVYATCRDQEGRERLNELQRDERLHVFEMSVTDDAQIKNVAEQLRGQPIDILFNNAATIEPRFYGSAAYEGHDDPNLRNYDFEGWKSVLDTNLLGPARVCGAFVDHLALSERPVAVMLSSTLASVSGTWQAGRYAYRTSKAALNMLTRSVGAWYQSKGIVMVSLSPGWTKTGMGGHKATNSIEHSVSQMRATVSRLTPDDAGSFFDFDGKQMPW
jgi:NAD(P)-dependent dehydrogenase (short-subunit alcohol dehydrogenase family)